MTSLFEFQTNFFNNLFSGVDEAEIAHNKMERDMLSGCQCKKCGEEVICLHGENEKHGNPLCGMCGGCAS